MVPAVLVGMYDALAFEHLNVRWNSQMDRVHNSNQGRSCYPAGQEKTITGDWWVGTAFPYQPRQQQQQRRLLQPRLLSVAVLDASAVAAAVDVAVAVVAVAAAVAVAAVVEHEPEPAHVPEAFVHDSRDGSTS